MADPKPKAEHKVRKSETMDTIAKKYGFKKVEDIWTYPRNKALVKLRKEPKNILPDDVVVIPAFNDEERKEISERQRSFAIAANMEKLAFSRFLEQAAADRKLADKMDKVAAMYGASAASYIKQYEASVSKADNWSNGVDAANAVLGILNALRGLAVKSTQASEALLKAGEAEFEKISKEVVKDARQFTTAPVTSELTKQTGKALADTKTGPLVDFRVYAGVVIESYGKWTSPSFYGQAIGILAEGKGWSAAATFDLQKDAKETKARMKAELDRVEKMAKEAASAARARAAASEAAANASQKKFKEFSEKSREF